MVQVKTQVVQPHAAGIDVETQRRLNRVWKLARALDSSFKIPGLPWSIGADGLIGLIPGIGDFATAALSAYIVKEAVQLGAPRHVIARMVANIGIDALVGAVPLVGDIADIGFKANLRNAQLLEDALTGSSQLKGESRK